MSKKKRYSYRENCRNEKKEFISQQKKDIDFTTVVAQPQNVSPFITFPSPVDEKKGEVQ